MRARTLLLLPIWFTVAFGILAAQPRQYVGSVNAGKYHVASCRYAKKIMPKNLRTFQTAAQAESLGYKPCKVCIK